MTLAELAAPRRGMGWHDPRDDGSVLEEAVQPSAAWSTKWWHDFDSQYADRCSTQQSRAPPRPGCGSRLLARRSGNDESDFSGGMAAVVTTILRS
ncbi:hypothetical protein M6B38_396585 [Iris pallida]|uniref:Uncharacterized protein n=1 Tax=Iris pallida TaxID=29817 RepID=A0AAX6FV71_IRIPA|nr:hypothetical protein M6B38_142520 [Iris pallida]KAJ6820359.1 hypothetical protein M6B38_396585 [Iris pallida]